MPGKMVACMRVRDVSSYLVCLVLYLEFSVMDTFYQINVLVIISLKDIQNQYPKGLTENGI